MFLFCSCIIILVSSLLREFYLVQREHDQVDRQLNTGVHYHLKYIMAKQTFMPLSSVLHVFPTQFSKKPLLDVPRMAPEMILPALLCTDYMCAFSSLVKLSTIISEYSKPGIINYLVLLWN